MVRHLLFMTILLLLLILYILMYSSTESFASASASYQLQYDQQCLSSKNLSRVSCDKPHTTWTVNDFNMLLSEEEPAHCLTQHGTIGTNDCAILTNDLETGQFIQMDGGKVLDQHAKWIPTQSANQSQLYKLSQLTLK
jgi:hypothetical protein